MSFNIRRPGRYFSSNNAAGPTHSPSAGVSVSSIHKVFDKYRGMSNASCLEDVEPVESYRLWTTNVWGIPW